MTYMEVIENLVSSADMGGLAVYATVMAGLLGSVGLARLRDDAIDIRTAKRRVDSDRNARMLVNPADEAC
jgi:hypothetical protein